MATTAQTTVPKLVDKWGEPIESGLYVPAASAQGFAAPVGIWYGVDSAGNPSAYAGHAPPFIPAAQMSAQSGTIAVAGTSTTLTLPAPGAGLRLYLCGVQMRAGPVASFTAGTVGFVTSSTGLPFIPSLVIGFSTTLATADEFLPPQAIAATAANTLVSVTFGASASAPTTIFLRLWGMIVPE